MLKNIVLKSILFSRHLREKHCSQEGGSFVCRYGTNGVCSSLPVEGVSDEDYEDHVLRHHASRPHHGVAQKQQSDGPHWTVYSTAQNLPAVLNDPSRGKEVSMEISQESQLLFSV